MPFRRRQAILFRPRRVWNTDLVNTIADVRDRAALKHAYAAAQPDIVVHLAAQPLVSVGYANPGETFETNVMGTVNLLDCVRERVARRSS